MTALIILLGHKHELKVKSSCRMRTLLHLKHKRVPCLTFWIPHVSLHILKCGYFSLSIRSYLNLSIRRDSKNFSETPEFSELSDSSELAVACARNHSPSFVSSGSLHRFLNHLGVGILHLGTLGIEQCISEPWSSVVHAQSHLPSPSLSGPSDLVIALQREHPPSSELH